MLKGCQRQMVVLRGDADSVFETAYFLLKRDKEESEDLIAVANALVDKNAGARTRRRSVAARVWICAGIGFLAGLSLGIGLSFLW